MAAAVLSGDDGLMVARRSANRTGAIVL